MKNGTPEGHADSMANVHSWDIPISQRPSTPLDQYHTSGYFASVAR